MSIPKEIFATVTHGEIDAYKSMKEVMEDPRKVRVGKYQLIEVMTLSYEIKITNVRKEKK